MSANPGRPQTRGKFPQIDAGSPNVKPKTGPPHNVRLTDQQGRKLTFFDRSDLSVNVYAHVINLRGWPRKTRKVHYFEIPADSDLGLQMMQQRFGKRARIYPMPTTAIPQQSQGPTNTVGQQIDAMFDIAGGHVTPRGFRRYEQTLEVILNEGQKRRDTLETIENNSHFLVIFERSHNKAFPRRISADLRPRSAATSALVRMDVSQAFRPTSSSHLQRHLTRPDTANESSLALTSQLNSVPMLHTGRTAKIDHDGPRPLLLASERVTKKKVKGRRPY